MKNIRINEHTIGRGFPAFVIAEIGINHEGDIHMARELVSAAKETGADAVKFQVVFADTLYPEKERVGWQKDFYELIKKIELDIDAYAGIKELSDALGLVFFGSFNDAKGIDILARLNSGAYKIASTQMNNLPLVHHAAQKGRPVLVSTGMASLGEIDACIQTVRQTGNDNIALLHCVSNYPMKPEEANLAVMDTLQFIFKAPTGFSDHSTDGLASIAAVARGACLIERHFSIDPKRKSFDHHLSSGPAQLKRLIDDIRIVEKTIGSGEKTVAESEKQNSKLYRVSLCAAEDIEKGAVITESMISASRPASGLNPVCWRGLIGKKIKRSLKAGGFFKWSDLD